MLDVPSLKYVKFKFAQHILPICQSRDYHADGQTDEEVAREGDGDSNDQQTSKYKNDGG